MRFLFGIFTFVNRQKTKKLKKKVKSFSKKIPEKAKKPGKCKRNIGFKTAKFALKPRFLHCLNIKKSDFWGFEKNLKFFKLFFKKVLTNEKACAILVERCWGNGNANGPWKLNNKKIYDWQTKEVKQISLIYFETQKSKRS